MILVTGATGNVGREVVEQLRKKGQEVRAFGRDAEKARSLLGPDVDIVEGDLDRPETIESALAGIDRVFLLANSSPEQLAQERNVLAAAKNAGVRQVVKLSVFGADDQSPVQLARWHRETEQELEQSGLAYTILRPAFFMQNLFGMVSGGSIYTAAEDGKIAMVDVGDIAAVAAAALTDDGHEGKTYDITGPEALSFDEAAEKLSRSTGTEITHVRIPPEAVTKAMRDIGAPDWHAEDVAAIQGAIAAGYAATTTATVREVAKKEPRTFEAFAQEFASAGDRAPVS